MMRKTPMPRPFSDGSPACVRRAGCLRACPPSRRPGWPGCAWPRPRPSAWSRWAAASPRSCTDWARGARLVGDDQSSLYPPEARRLPSVGYYRAVPVEGVLSLKPDLVLASEQAGPPDALKRLGEVGVRVVTVPDQPSVDSLKARIRAVADAGCAAGRRAHDRGSGPRAGPRRGAARQARARHAADQSWRRAAGAGRDTAASQLMALAGLVNVMQGQQGYKPLSAGRWARWRPTC